MTDQLSIAAIVVGERRREDYGDLDGLAESIERFGLLHPVVVDEAGNLVAGERRLRACEQLGWTVVDVRRLGDLTEAERREIELEENLRRKDLTPFEQAKVMTGLAATAGEVLKQRETDFSPTVGEKSRGRPTKPDSLDRVAERIGVPRETIRRAQEHVQTVEDHPFMGGPDWKQYHVLEAREHLSKLPEPERPKAAALIDAPGIPPKDANRMLANLAAMPEPEREHVLTLAESDDSRDRSEAVTRAAAVPAMPDPRMPVVMDAVTALRKAARMFPSDPLTPRIEALLAEAKALYQTVKEQQHVA